MKHEKEFVAAPARIDTPTAALLRKALDLLEAEGWCQYAGSLQYGPRCAVTALAASQDFSTDDFGEAIRILQRVVTGGLLVSRWNDARARTYPEVRAAFLKAIEAA